MMDETPAWVREQRLADERERNSRLVAREQRLHDRWRSALDFQGPRVDRARLEHRVLARIHVELARAAMAGDVWAAAAKPEWAARAEAAYARWGRAHGR